MPLCTTCTYPVQHLYTVYQSEHNLRLEQCPHCHSFADPYVEHDALTLLLDLILLKRGVYRHLLFNRGAAPKRAPGPRIEANTSERDSEQRERNRRRTVLKLELTLIMIDAFIRWSNHYPLGTANLGEPSLWNQEAGEIFLKTLAGCFIETVSYHVGVTFCCALALCLLNGLGRGHKTGISSVRREFRLSHVPLTLLYSSLTKLFLLLMLSIWRPENTESERVSWGTYNNPLIDGVLELLDEDKLDRQWVVRNVLGGMAAGFGLRVVLDCHPVLTVLIILGGLGVKTSVSNVMSGWIGKAEGLNDAWLAYSIP